MQNQQTTSRQALANLFDYAGLFPPAGLSMSDTVANFRKYQQGRLAWMLNTIVIPATRLQEFSDVAAVVDGDVQPARLSVLSSDWQQDQPLIEHFRSQHTALGSIVSVESRQLADASKIARKVDRVYVEIPFSDDVRSNIEAIKQAGACAKIRTGGLTADAFPDSKQLAAFVLACCQCDVSFKATAGLHHPLAKTRPTCSGKGAPLAPMHGFANLFAAVATAEQQASPDEVAHVLSLSEDEAKVQFGKPGFWDTAQAARQRFHSIGSCSFDEPINDLVELGWL